MFYRTDGDHGLPHNPFKALVAPRPIGWISSVSADGVVNLAPYSFFNAVSDRPPMVMFAANGRHATGGHKDSLKNVQETGEFVCSLATWDLRESMNASSADVGREVDEFALVGLTPEPAELVRPPRVKESPVHLECRWLHTVTLPCDAAGMSNNVVFGHVIGIHIDESVIKDGLIDIPTLRPVARLGYFDYAVVNETFAMKRPR